MANFATIADASREFRVSERTVRRWISAGRLTAYRTGPRLVRIDMNEMDDLLRIIPTVGNVA
jgi:excisionase family DNA binding protein